MRRSWNQVAVVAHEAVHDDDLVHGGFERLVLGDGGGEDGAGTAGEDFAHAREAELLDRRAGPRSEPRLVGDELPVDLRPLVGRQARRPDRRGACAARGQRDDHLAIELRERERPGRVDAFEQRQRTVRLDPRQRESAHFPARRRKLPARDRLVLRLGAVERGRGPAVERRQPAAREVVIHLRPDRLERLIRVRRRVAQRQDRRGVVLGLPAPVGEGLKFGEELVELGLRDAGRSAAVHLTADAGDDVGDDGPDRWVVHRIGRDDAVAVEPGLSEDHGRVGGVGQGDRSGIGLAEAGEHQARRGQQLRALRRLGADGGQGQRLGALGDLDRVLEDFDDPVDGGDDLRRADAAIVVGVQQIEGLRVELEAVRRAAQRHPELLVEVLERGQVGVFLQRHLVHAAGPEEFPPVRRAVRA